MIPLLLISNNDNKVNKFVDDFIQKNKYLAHLIFKLYPSKSEFIIDQVKTLRKSVGQNVGAKRLFILFDFNKASIEAQNALLKTLEEYTGYNQFILVSSNQDAIVETIRSRAKTILLDQDKLDLSVKKEVVDLFNKLLKENSYSFLADQFIIGLSREEAIDFLDQIVLYLRSQLTRKESVLAAKIIKKAFEIKPLLQNNNLHVQLGIDNFLIFTHKIYHHSP